MENTNPSTSQGLLKPAINHAVLVSIVVIVITLIFYLAGQLQNRYFSWVVSILTFAGVLYSMFNYRNQNLGGYISYGNALGYGVVVTLFVGIITGVFSLLLYHVISPELIDEALIEVERNILRRNPDTPYEAIQFTLRITKWMLSPVGIMISGVFGGAFQGLIFGLIGGIFVKKKDPEAFLQ